MHNSYYDMYKSRIGESYYAYTIERWAPFYATLVQFLKDRRALNYITEEGAGIGTFSRYLMERMGQYHFTLVDNDKDMLALLKKNYALQGIPLLRTVYQIEERDLREKAKQQSDLTFSHGVLEHMSDEDILTVVGNQLSQLSRVGILVHYVPTDVYETQSLGDERLLPVSYWLDLVQPTRHFTFNSGRDLVLIWDKEAPTDTIYPKIRTYTPPSLALKRKE